MRLTRIPHTLCLKLLAATVFCATTLAQKPADQWQKPKPADQWQKPKPADQWQKPKPADQWQKPKPADQWQKPGEIQKPGELQKPGEFRVPKGEIQKPGEIQAPKGIQAIKTQQDKCQQRFALVADALFGFNQWTLTPQAEETLNALRPLLAQAGRHPVSLEGHTDSIGTDAYNLRLSERRAQAVKAWLAARQAIPATALSKGFGETRPVAPNANPDGSDNPAGRQRNRRVEVVLDTCH